MAESIQLAVIGAGPAGLGAAIEAAELGLPVTLIDAAPLPGGQVYKQTPLAFRATPEKNGRRLLDRLDRAEVRLLMDTLVWGIFAEPDGHLLCLHGPAGTPRRLLAQRVILAPGAHDRPLPFPGWTLPGVMTAGAALNLVKHQRVLPGRRILLSGTGPLQLVLAGHLIDAGAELVGILDLNGFPKSGWRHLGTVWGQWERLGEGWRAWRTLRSAGKRIRWGHTVFQAQGDGQVERAVIGPLDGSRPQVVNADVICLGYGFTPATQLSHQIGCEHRYQADQRATIPIRDAWLQTTVKGFFVAGDGAGIGGKDTAYNEGRLAALGAARTLGQEIERDRISQVRRELARQQRFANALSALFPQPSWGDDLLTDDTILCRCEEVTVADIRRVIDEGANTVSAIRRLTRAGMGRCQGRMCGRPVGALLARQLGRPMEEIAYATPRPPIMPVPIDGLLEVDPRLAEFAPARDPAGG